MREQNHTEYDFVSVIIPVYNDQPGIDACLRALSAQTWPKDRFEIIVVDNDSDPPIRLDSSLCARLVYCSISGSYAARNVGIASARGEVLAFTDADCLPDPEWIATGVAALVRNKGRCVIGGEVELVLSQKPTSVELYQYLGGFSQRENIEQRGFSVTANIFSTRSQIEHVGIFNESFFSGGDREWCWRAACSGYQVIFARDVKVTTTPRRSMAGALRQARRIAGGRYKLCRIASAHVNPLWIKPHREGWTAAKWILTHPELSGLNRIRVFSVALILRAAQVLETLRLSSGMMAERR